MHFDWPMVGQYDVIFYRHYKKKHLPLRKDPFNKKASLYYLKKTYHTSDTITVKLPVFRKIQSAQNISLIWAPKKSFVAGPSVSKISHVTS